MNPGEIITEEATLQRLESVCKRRFGNRPEADECYLFILEKCQENDFRRLRSFAGRSSLKTYLYTLFNNLSADFKRARFGRKRIPKIIAAIGEWAEKVYSLVCWQRYSYSDAWEIVSLNDLYSHSFNRFLTDIEQLNKAPCTENPQFFSTDDEGGHDLAETRPGSNPLQAFIDKLDLQKRLKAAKIIRQYTASRDGADQLLLRLIYGDNHSIAAAGRLVGLSSMQAQRRLKKLLSGYREALLGEGITGLKG